MDDESLRWQPLPRELLAGVVRLLSCSAGVMLSKRSGCPACLNVCVRSSVTGAATGRARRVDVDSVASVGSAILWRLVRSTCAQEVLKRVLRLKTN